MPKPGRVLIILWLLCMASVPLAAAGLPFTIHSWETEDGLPQNTVTCITQTRDGYLWVGTLNGLVRFDGLQFTVFDENNSPGLESSRITYLFEDSQGGLWIGTDSGALALMKQGRLTSQGLGQSAPERRVAAAAEDALGQLWFYTVSGELWRKSDAGLTPFLFEWGRQNNRRYLAAAGGGPLWIGAENRLAVLSSNQPPGTLEPRIDGELKSGRLDYLLAGRTDGLWRFADGQVGKWRGQVLERNLGAYPWRSAPITSACEDSFGNLVVGTSGLGVFWYGADGQVAWLSKRDGLSSEVVLAVHVDRENNLWVGTDGGGLNRVRRQVFSVLGATAQFAVQSACDDGEGGLWVGLNGGGVLRWRDDSPRVFGRNEGLPRLQVWSVLRDRDGRVWAGTYGAGLLQWRDNRFQPAIGFDGLPPEVTALFQDRQGMLWVGTQGALARWDGQSAKLYTTNDGLSSSLIVSMADDAQGNLWIGTKGGGINQLREGRFTAVRKSPGGLPSDDIAFVHGDAEGVLWIGTLGSGLARWQNGRWTRYTTREGLAGNGLCYLIEDGQGIFWIGSNAGVMRVAKKSLNDFARGELKFIPCRTYGKADGLLTRECTVGSQPAVGQTRDGRLWFPTAKGIASVNPSQLNANLKPPPVMITSVLVDGQLMAFRNVGDELRLSPGKNRLEVHFTSLNLAAPERARFRYQLEGQDEEAVEAGGIRVARYPELPPGHYRFKVTACNEDGIWNEAGATLALVVLPPFWRTWWFLTGSSVGLVSLLVVVVRYISTQRLQRQVEKMRQQEALEKERARIARDIHDQLGANLTQISLLGELVESDKEFPSEVAAHARQISQTARETTRGLDEIVWTVNPANDTVEGLANYICKYVQDYLRVAGLKCRLEVPPQLPSVAIAPEVRHHVFMTVKEAVTNIVRHAGAQSAWLKMRLAPCALVIEIEDDGRGLGNIEEKLRTRNGLRNMRKRMEDAGGQFQIEARQGGGTVVRLTLPLAQ